MVQKKAPTKLALQPDHVAKTKNQLHPQDVKNIKGPDLKKKKMKKSGSFKRQDHVKQPGKPKPTPPAASFPPCSSAAATATPNYMRSTTSSDAREVSPKSPHHDISSLRRKSSNNSKLTLASSNNNKATKTMRTLTKNPSFKPSRASSSVRKCSQVVFCENLDSQRSTCSSTLKDSKFPAYLSLKPGATESQGTSIIKVCPYTYCSLNGHRHVPLLPLKCFVSARRRMIKAQRSVKLGCLSPRRVKGVIGDGHKFDEKLIMKDDSESVRISPLTEEERDDDFFVEIYSKKNEDQEEQVLETVSEASMFCYEVDAINESVDQEGDVNSMDFKVDENEIQNVRFDEQDFEVSDMEWETESHHRSALQFDYDYEYECSPEADIKSDELVESHVIIDDDEFIIKTGKEQDRCFDEFSAVEVSQESFEDEQSFNSNAFSNSDDDGDSIDSYDYPQILNNMNNLATVEVPSEEPNESSDEDQTSNPEKYQENSTESFINMSPTDKCKAKNEAKNETEDGALVLAITKRKKPIEDVDESGPFNPRAPNFLPLEPDPGAEKVNLKHQDLDERRNAEEWMVDYALRQVVTKLGPARKRKVALLVEAFEKVTPVKKCELHLRHTSAFDQARPMQACT